MTLVVIVVTYFSVVIGELVPKRLGLLAPERVASLIARPMNLLARLGRPLVWLLSSSSSLLLSLLGARRRQESSVTDDEIKVLMEPVEASAPRSAAAAKPAASPAAYEPRPQADSAAAAAGVVPAT